MGMVYWTKCESRCSACYDLLRVQNQLLINKAMIKTKRSSINF